MFKRIVVAVDFSQAWPRLQQRLQALLPWGVEHVTLVHVLSSRYPATPEVSHRAHYETRLGEEAGWLAAAGLVVDWQVRVGEPGAELASACSETAADLLLIGSRGYSRMREFFIGSTALDAARLARAPLWLEPVTDDPGSQASGVLLLATDGSPSASSAEVMFLRLRPRFARAVAAMATSASDGFDREKSEAAAHLQQLAGDQPGLDTRILDGDPRQAIVQLAKALPADLVIVGKRGRNALHDLMLGSTAEAVCRNAGRPVLLVPVAAAA